MSPEEIEEVEDAIKTLEEAESLMLKAEKKITELSEKHKGLMKVSLKIQTSRLILLEALELLYDIREEHATTRERVSEDQSDDRGGGRNSGPS